MKTYFRAQVGSYTFAEMQQFVSSDGGDGLQDAGGLCACGSVSELMRNTVMGALNDTDEIVAFRGRIINEIYDGYRVYPVEEIARWTKAEFLRDAEAIAWDYED